MKEICKIIKSLKTTDEISQFFNEIFTKSELDALSKRWRILKMLSNGETQRDIACELKVSLCKVTRGSRILKGKETIVNRFLNKGKNNE